MDARVVYVVAMIAFGAGVCTASDRRAKTRGSIEEFELYTKCVGVLLVVEHRSQDAEETGLTRKEIVDAVESRLRSAGLNESRFFGFSEGSVVFLPHLYMHVNVIGQSF